MQMIRKGIEILRTEGLFAFLRAILRFVYWNLGMRRVYLTLRHRMAGPNTTVTIGGVSATMFTGTYAAFERFYDLKGERDTLTDVLAEISGEGVFYDIGANVGLYSCLVGSAAPESTVYAFEPHPTNVEALKQNLQLNAINGTIFQIALSNEEGTLELSSEGSEAGLGKHSLNVTDSELTIPVTVRRLDALRDKHDVPVPSVVKIDVEGAELDVIEGGSETFADPGCRTIYCEIHPNRLPLFGGSYDEVTNLLSSLGFELEVLEREIGQRIMVKATK